MLFLIPLVLIALLFLPLFAHYRALATGRAHTTSKKVMMLNLSAFALVCLVSVVLPLGGAAAAASAGGVSIGSGLGYLGAALSTGLACVGAGIAVAHGSAAAIGAITEDSKVFGRAMIFVVLGEGIAIYGLAISIMMITRL